MPELLDFQSKTDLDGSYKGNVWVEITDKFAVIKDRNNKDSSFILPEEIVPAEQPENPYLYPY